MISLTDIASILETSFHMKRETGYYLLNIYIPCSMLVVMSWVTFWINREASAARVSLGKNFNYKRLKSTLSAKLYRAPSLTFMQCNWCLYFAFIYYSINLQSFTSMVTLSIWIIPHNIMCLRFFIVLINSASRLCETHLPLCRNHGVFDGHHHRSFRKIRLTSAAVHHSPRSLYYHVYGLCAGSISRVRRRQLLH